MFADYFTQDNINPNAYMIKEMICGYRNSGKIDGMQMLNIYHQIEKYY
jgi:hypothetical protein